MTVRDGVVLGEAERRYVLAVVSRYFESQSDREDAAQETLLLAHRGRASFDGRSRLTTWLYRIATNVALGMIRLRAHRPVGTEDGLELVASTADVEAVVGAVHRAGHAFDALECKLSREYVQIFVAYFVDHEPLQALADRFGITKTACYTRAYRAQRFLRAYLAANDGLPYDDRHLAADYGVKAA